MENFKINHPPVDTLWKITRSMAINHPEAIAADDLAELRSRVVEVLEKGNKHREDKKKIKNPFFRYEIDERGYVTKVFVYFMGYRGNPLRAMKLERE